MGFGIASQLPRERQSPEPAESIAGTLAYMAPEQTGRAVSLQRVLTNVIDNACRPVTGISMIEAVTQ
jgi:serine/threonine protein kinase